MPVNDLPLSAAVPLDRPAGSGHRVRMRETRARFAPHREASRSRRADAHAAFQRAEGARLAGDPGGAARLYKKALDLDPRHWMARDRLAFQWLAEGKAEAASEQFAVLAEVAPQILLQFDKALEILKRLLPSLGGQIAAGLAPARDDLARAAADPFLRAVLESTVVRDLGFERWLRAARRLVLAEAATGAAEADADLLAFACALARQCFIDEYVWSASTEENGQLGQLEAGVGAALANGDRILPLAVAALAMYGPLLRLGGADRLAAASWPRPVRELVRQQVDEPRQEQALRSSIPRLTGIDGDTVGVSVRSQYEEHPYPRWVRLPAPPDPLMVFDDHLRHQFPDSAFVPTGRRDSVDVLIAGCGTGRYAMEVAQGFRGARVLGIDMSLASLASARRRLPPQLEGAVEFAQADIMRLGALSRRFDVISVTGVLHHMADPLGGWRTLAGLLNPNGLMQVALYSAHARQDVLDARKTIAARGLRGTLDDIRAVREELIAQNAQHPFMKLNDFFSTSELRDLLFHAHEVQFTIPEIAGFLDSAGLRFIGFEFSPQPAHLHYRGLFKRNGWRFDDLNRWDAFERENPNVFAGMYILWVQRP